MATDNQDESGTPARTAGAVRRRARLIGMLLIATAGLAAFSNLALVVVAKIAAGASPPPQPPAGMRRDDREAFERGRDAGRALDTCCPAVVTLAVYVPVLIGGVRLTGGRAGGTAVAAGVLALMPCSPAFLLGLPVGIWALVFATSSNTRGALAPPRRRRPRRDEDEDDWDDEEDEDRPRHRRRRD